MTYVRISEQDIYSLIYLEDKMKKNTVIGNMVKNDINDKITALYIRVSTERQYEEGYSIDAQKDKLIAQCKLKDYDNYEFYIDGGYTGSNLNRPEMQRLISDIEQQKINSVIVYKLDRLSRSQKDTLYLIEDVFNPNGVDFISINENFDTTTPYGRLMIGILSSFAQLERENIYLRTRMGMSKRVEKGFWMGGGRIPFGYDYDEKQGILIPNKDAETVRKIFSLYLDGKSTITIAKILGLKYDRFIREILERKTYIGMIVFRGLEYQGKHEPLISIETYERAMEIMELRSNKNIKKSKYLLSGLILCGKCGARMRYQKWGANTKITCYSKDKYKPHLIKDENCPSENYNSDIIEEYVLNDLSNLRAELKNQNTKVIATNILDTLYRRKLSTSSVLKNLYNKQSVKEVEILDTISTKEIKKLENEIEILKETIADYEDDLSDINEQIEEEELRNTLTKKAESIKKEIENIEDIWDDLDIDRQKTLLQKIIKEIIIDGKTITINYNI